MICKSPVNIKTEDRNVPCGQCMACRINSGRKWTARILMEEASNWHKYANPSYFLTLTYDDDHLPTTLGADDSPTPTLEKKKTLKWVNHLERNVGPVRYYIVGEYGDLSRRPHYHMAVFPKYLGQAQDIAALWNKGFTQTAEMLPQRAAYLANYTTKKLTRPDDHRLDGRQEPEFRTSNKSPPLGTDYSAKLAEDYSKPKWRKRIEEMGDIPRTCSLHGKTYPVPAYVLNQVRKELGIPLLHRDRRDANINYLKYFSTPEAEWLPEEAEQQENYLAEKKRQKLHRGSQRC